LKPHESIPYEEALKNKEALAKFDIVKNKLEVEVASEKRKKILRIFLKFVEQIEILTKEKENLQLELAANKVSRVFVFR
jgi:hypothetical protein